MGKQSPGFEHHATFNNFLGRKPGGRGAGTMQRLRRVSKFARVFPHATCLGEAKFQQLKKPSVGLILMAPFAVRESTAGLAHDLQQQGMQLVLQNASGKRRGVRATIFFCDRGEGLLDRSHARSVQTQRAGRRANIKPGLSGGPSFCRWHRQYERRREQHGLGFKPAFEAVLMDLTGAHVNLRPPVRIYSFRNRRGGFLCPPSRA